MQGISICLSCKHLGDAKSTDESSGDLLVDYPVPSCTAFPNGIPVDIYYNGFDHRNKFGGEVERFGFEVLYELNNDPDMIEFAESSLNQYISIKRVMDATGYAQ